MKVVILAGGMGTRLQEHTVVRPKPMIEIGSRPMLWHIMKLYAHHGHREFVLAVGYKAEIIQEYFLNYHRLLRTMTVDLADGRTTFYDEVHDDWRVHLVDTGTGTETGGRLRRLRSWLEPEPFMMTYGDGVGDVDIPALLAFHRNHGRLATVTAVRPPSRFGGLALEGDRVAHFEEKPQIGEGWINGGFFVLDPRVLELIPDDATIWERGPLETLAERGELMAYRHTGFWHPMDTVRDLSFLEGLWAAGRAPWKVWA